ncbi:MAG: FxsA family protein [Alphaproteobacteria bacterium]
MGLAIFLALIGVPIVEIGVFVEVGGRIGLWSTLGLIVLTALIGTALLRQQGLATLASARETIENGNMPVQQVLDGVCLLIAGALLLTPGFVTDAFGALLLIPGLRHPLQRWALRRLAAHGRVTVETARHPRRDGVIDGEFTVVVEEGEEGDGPPDPRLGRPRGDGP